MTDPVTPAAAPATPAAPAAAAPAKPTESLIPAADPATPAAPAAATPATPAAPANPASKWFYSEGVEGKGNAPDWFKAGKYVTVEQQAKAYPELEKRLGSFVGAPEGDYKIALPKAFEGKVDIDTTNPVFAKLTDWGKKHQLSQTGFDDVMGLLAEYEQGAAPVPRTADDARKEIGANADVRITAVANFAKANLDAAGQEAVRQALRIDNPAIAQTLTAIEGLIKKTRQPSLPKPGDDVPPIGANEFAEINALQAKLGPDGQRLYVSDSKFRADVEARRMRYYQAQGQAA